MKISDLKKKIKYKGSYFLAFAIFVTVVFVYIWVVGPGNTVRHWIGSILDHKDNQKQIEWYQEEIKDMDVRINLLHNDKDTLEKFAREHFGFAEKDEDVYMLE